MRSPIQDVWTSSETGMTEKVLTMEPQHTGLIAEDVFCCVTEVIDLVSIQEEFPVICRLPLPRVEELPQHDLQGHEAPLSAKQAVPSSDLHHAAAGLARQNSSLCQHEGKAGGSTPQLHCHAPHREPWGPSARRSSRHRLGFTCPLAAADPARPYVLPCGRLALTWLGQTWGCGQTHGSACPRCQSPC